MFNIYIHRIRVSHALLEDKALVKSALIKILYFRIIYAIKLKAIVKDVGISEHG